MAADTRVDAVVVSTAVDTHFEIAAGALRAGKHVLVEKPMARTGEEVLRLMDESERRRLVLMVDHTFVFSPAVCAIREALAASELGRPGYFDSMRLNLGLVRRDVNVVWDLASHDVAILHYLFPGSPSAVMVAGMSPQAGGLECLAYLTLFFPDNFIAHINVSWISPIKVRRIAIGGSQGTLLYDDLQQEDKVRIYDSGFERGVHTDEARRRHGEVRIPTLSRKEPLLGAVEHFAECIEKRAVPLADGVAALRVVRLLEAADRSLEVRGGIISLEPEGVWA